MPAVSPTLNESKVRKWGTVLFAIADTTTAIPDNLFGGDYLPIALPSGFKDLGFITTDGVTAVDSLSSEPTNMLQSLEAVRTDVTGREMTLSAVFGESNAWVNALYHSKRVSEFGADRDGAWDFTEAGISDTPYYRILMFGQDGVGDDAVYRVEAAYKAKVTAKTDRALGRSNPETFGFTFGLFRDQDLDKTYRRAEDGPSMHTPSTLPVISTVTPTGGAVGDVVKVSGTRFVGVTGITMDAVTVTDYQVHDANTIYLAIPATVSGAADVVVTTSAGASTAYAYTAA